MGKSHTKIYVYQVSLPDRINEIVTPCSDGYTVYIKESLDETSKRKALVHALKHIDNDDFHKDNVQQIEYQAHRKE